MKKVILLSILSYSLFGQYVSITTPTTTQKPLMSYSNYSTLTPMKTDHFNNNVKYPILPQKMSFSTYQNLTNSKVMNTKTLPPYYFPSSY